MSRFFSKRTLVAFLFCAGAAHAQLPARGQPARPAVSERREMRDDLRDARAAHELLNRYDTAFARKDQRALRQLDQNALSLIQDELRESRWESVRAHREVRQSEQELHNSRIEYTRSPGRADALHARADDRRDLRDDRRDAAMEHADRARVQRIQSDFLALRHRYDFRSVSRKRALLVELTERSHWELNTNARERQEDRRERREDRRADRG